uniref:LEM domain-containing protein n=1 Tax=Panagrellus redivivus TaxID=6233 RepID=A0A7E4UT01_PANRE
MSTPYEDYSNDQIRTELLKRGIVAGPVQQSTRAIYIKKLIAASASGDASTNNVTNGVAEASEEAPRRAKSRTPEEGEIDLRNGQSRRSASPEFVDADEEGEHQEYSRVLTPEELATRFRSPMQPRRRQMKKNQTRLTYVLLAIFAVLVAMVLANALGIYSITEEKVSA